MKMKSLLVITIIIAFASIAFSQTVIIQPKKTLYTRKFNVSFKEKRTFTATYPLFNGTMSSAAKKKLANTISYWRVFETTLAENLNESDWLSELYYRINYNKKGLLDISLTQEGSGAYPDSQTVNLIIDLKTGERVKFADVFKSTTMLGTAMMVNKKLKLETAAIIKRIDKGEFGANGKEADDSLKEQLNALEFTSEKFDEFSISDKGVTFLYDAGFPHVIQAAQPEGRYLFTWAELKPYIKADGLLGKFVR